MTGYLYKDDKLLLIGLWEDLIDFVEELKKLNNDFIDRREFKVLYHDKSLAKKWIRKWNKHENDII